MDHKTSLLKKANEALRKATLRRQEILQSASRDQSLDETPQQCPHLADEELDTISDTITKESENEIIKETDEEPSSPVIPIINPWPY